MACNNAPALCDRGYNQVTHMGAHDIAFLRDESTGTPLAGNHFLNATLALDAGIRLLQAQVHDSEGVLQLCHTSCALLDAGPLEDWLALIGDWMAANPNEVVTILLVNADDHSAADYGAAFTNAGLADLGFAPQADAAFANWPTLGEMIAQDTRLVTFIASAEPSAEHPFILNQFDYMFETAFENLIFGDFDCALDRANGVTTSQQALSQNYLSLVNHFLYEDLGSGILIPAVDLIDEVNSADGTVLGSLSSHVKMCAEAWGARPNFVLVDFWSEGDPAAVADESNDVAAATGRTSPDDVASGGDGDDDGEGAGVRVGFGPAGVLTLVAVFWALV